MMSGRRDQRILLQYPVESNNSGSTETNWINYKTVWANESQEKGREFFAASQINNTNPVLYTMNYDDSIIDTFRVVHKNRIFEIKSINKNKRYNENKLYCTETT